MTVDIKAGQWVLALHMPFGPYVRTMTEVLEGFAVKHWMDSYSKEEVFFVAKVQKVMPKTFVPAEPQRYEGEKISRCQVIAAFRTREAALALRDKLFAIGEEAGEAIEKEMYRRIEKFAAKKRAAAERKIRRLLPHHFPTSPAEGDAA
ncbi:hypothetical protein IB270_07650 [Ensifer sp. ENS05]|uniref:hypothetical protein n=1 Tax=Ensifer sp. ENS05 TaxID=2769277 RepID=UPI0017835602|nr:hypothetical protein [Ensifer sp. ENS05]MBD9592703.1 hypothetical protein [Ensifer sp. ENS05]